MNGSDPGKTGWISFYPPKQIQRLQKTNVGEKVFKNEQKRHEMFSHTW